MRALLASASAALAAGATIAAVVIPTAAASADTSSCQRAATAQAVASARSSLHNQVAPDYVGLRNVLSALGTSGLEAVQAEPYARDIIGLQQVIDQRYSAAVLAGLPDLASVRARAAAWRPVAIQISDVIESAALALATEGGNVDLTTPAAQAELARERAAVAALPASTVKTAATNALARMTGDARSFTIMLKGGFEQLATTDFRFHIPVLAQLKVLEQQITVGPAVLRFLDDADVLTTALPGSGSVGFAKVSQVKARPAIDSAVSASRRSAELSSASQIVPAAVQSCAIVSLRSAQATLDVTIALTMAGLEQSDRDIRTAHLPDQQKSYAHSIAAIQHLRDTVYSSKAIYRLSSKAKVAALSKRWTAERAVIDDLRGAIDTAVSLGGGVISSLKAPLGPALLTVTFLVHDKAVLGLDETTALAAVDRIPAEISALSVQAVPALNHLSTADFSKHSDVVARQDDVDAVFKTSLGDAFFTDLATATTAALGSSDSSFAGQAQLAVQPRLAQHASIASVLHHG